MIPVVKKLKGHGVGAILDYAAESELESGPAMFGQSDAAKEAYHESNTKALMSSIISAAKVESGGHTERFAALKVKSESPIFV